MNNSSLFFLGDNFSYQIIAQMNVLTCVHAFAGNAILLLIAYRLRKKTLNFLIAGLGFTELNQALGGVVLYLPTALGYFGNSKGACLNLASYLLFFIYATAIMQLALATDRYVAVRHYNEYRMWAGRSVRVVLLLPSLVAGAAGLAVAHSTVAGDVEVTACFADESLDGAGKSYFILVNVTPLLLSGVVYGLLYRILNETVRNCTKCSGDAWAGQCSCAEHQSVLKTLLLILCVGLLSRATAFVLVIASKVTTGSGMWTEDQEKLLSCVDSVPGLLSGGTNCYIIFTRTANFRKEFRKLFGFSSKNDHSASVKQMHGG